MASKYHQNPFLLSFFMVVGSMFGLALTADAAERSPAETLIHSNRELQFSEKRHVSIVGPKEDETNAVPLAKRALVFQQLQRLSEALTASGDPSALVENAATVTGLTSLEFNEVAAGDGWTMEVAADSDDSATLLDTLIQQKATLGAGAQVRFEPYRAEDVGGKFTSFVRVQTDTSSYNETSNWVVDWEFREDGKPPLIKSIVARDAVRTTLQSGHELLFLNRTANALSGVAAAQQLTLFDGDKTAELWSPRLGCDQAMTRLSGISVGDVNSDGRDDLFIPQHAPLPNVLLVRQEDGTLKNMASEMGIDWIDSTAMGLFVDLDNDGDQDLAVATASGLRVLSNEGERFEEKALLPIRFGAIEAADFNADGLVDLLVFDGVEESTVELIEHPRDLGMQFATGKLRVYQNGEGVQLKDVTSAVGLGDDAAGNAASWQDVDQDGDVDLVVSQVNGLGGIYVNDNGKFGNRKTLDSVASSTVAWGDVDRDGNDDCLITNGWTGFVRDANTRNADGVTKVNEGNVLFMGNGTDGVGGRSPLSAGWTNAAQFADLNNSGNLDLITLTGFVSAASGFQPPIAESDDPEDAPDPVRIKLGQELLGTLVAKSAVLAGRSKSDRMLEIALMLREGRSLAGSKRNQVHINTGNTGNTEQLFANVSSISGLDSTGDGRGIALSDWDHDGDIDVWMTNRNSPALQFFENQTGADTGDSIQLELAGTTCNRDAIGARVTVELESGAKRSQTVRGGQGYRSQSSRRLHIGIGKDDAVKSVSVRWPAPGSEETFTEVAGAGFYRLTEGAAAAESLTPASATLPTEEADLAAGAEPIRDLLLPVRPLFPELFYLTSGMEQTRRLDWKPGKPLLLVLWDPECEVCKVEMRRLSKLRGLDCMALAPLGAVKLRGLPASVARKQKFLNPDIDEEKGFHKVGFVEDALLDELLALHRHTFESPYHLKVPCSFLLDREGRLAATYRGQVDLKTVITHFTKLKLKGQELFDESLPFGGTLAGELPQTRPHTLIRDYLLAGRPDAAERLLSVEAEHPLIKSNFFSIKSLLGEMHLVLGDLEKARVLFDEYLEENPNDPVTLNNLGVLLAQEGKNEEAEAAWKKAAEFSDDYAGALQNYATHLLQKDRYAEATPIAKKLLKVAPESVDAHNLMAIILLRQKAYEAAEGHLKIIIALEPRAFGAYANLAKAYALQGKAGAARKVLEQGLEVKGIDDKSKRGLMTLLDRM